MQFSMKSYIDLDDTLADTSQCIQNTFKYKKYAINGSILKKNLSLIKDAVVWNKIKKTPSFWSSLPKTRNSDFIVNSAFNLAKRDWKNVFILTALPRLVYKKGTVHWIQAEKAKIAWVRHHYPLIPEDNIIVLYAKEKKIYATRSAILIDDSHKNVKAWFAKNGKAYHVDTSNQINILN